VAIGLHPRNGGLRQVPGLLRRNTSRPQRGGSFGRTPRYDVASRRMIVHTEIEKGVHGFWRPCASRISEPVRVCERAIGRGMRCLLRLPHRRWRVQAGGSSRLLVCN